MNNPKWNDPEARGRGYPYTKGIVREMLLPDGKLYPRKVNRGYNGTQKIQVIYNREYIVEKIAREVFVPLIRLPRKPLIKLLREAYDHAKYLHEKELEEAWKEYNPD